MKRCSFCRKSDSVTETLIASPYGRAYICDECVRVCLSLLYETADIRARRERVLRITQEASALSMSVPEYLERHPEVVRDLGMR